MLVRNLTAIAPASKFRVVADDITLNGKLWTPSLPPAGRHPARKPDPRTQPTPTLLDRSDAVSLGGLILLNPPSIVKSDVKGIESCVPDVPQTTLLKIRVIG